MIRLDIDTSESLGHGYKLSIEETKRPQTCRTRHDTVLPTREHVYISFAFFAVCALRVCYIGCCNLQKALGLLASMRQLRINPDVISYNAVARSAKED